MVLAAQVWHYWIAVPLVAGSVLAVLATLVGYYRKMSALKNPRR